MIRNAFSRSLTLPFTAGAGVLALVALQVVEPPKPPKQPNEYFHLQRAWPAHDIPATAHAEALTQARAMQNAPARSAAGAPWTAAGPENVGGRITAMAVDPNNISNIWIGGADGGVFHSTDGGVSWTPQLDSYGGLSIGALAAHPTVSGTLLAGTGEANGSGDSYDGVGMLKTTDFGATWTNVGLPNAQRIGRVAYNPNNPNVVHAAVCGGLYSKGPDRGMYRSTDGGATWAQTLFVSDSTSAIDVVVNPSNGDELYAAFWDRLRAPDNRSVAGPTTGIWKSVDGGDNWTELTNGLPTSNTDKGRIGLAIDPQIPSRVYAIYADTPGYCVGVWRTTNSGTSWSQRDDGSDISNLYSSFGWYFGNIRVDPGNSNTLYGLGQDLMKSTDGGVNWFSVLNSGMHVDIHDLWIDPNNSSRVYCGNDGGFYTSTNAASSWTHRNTLPITQFYAVTVDYQLPFRIYGGTQDNSTPRTLTGALDDWDVLIGGDGFTVVVDPTNSNVIYGEYQFGGFQKSTNGGSSFFTAKSGINSGDRTNWHTPFVMDPSDNQTLYFGTYRVYRTTNAAGSWSSISPDLTDGPGSGSLTFGTLTTLAVAPSAPNTIYSGSDDGNVHVTTNGGSNWTKIDAGLPVRWVTRVAVDPADDAVAYVTLSGYKEDVFTPYAYRTTNHGSTWTDITGNLPQAPVNDLIVDPQDSNRLYVATDVGVYTTADLGVSWELLGTDLPLSVIVDIELHDPTRTLIAGTHGRSSFRLDLNSAVDAPLAGVPAGPAGLQLAAPSPNPARGPVRLSFTLLRDRDVRFTVHDVAGRLVREIASGAQSAGTHEFAWDGRTRDGRVVPTGAYFARLESEGEVRTAKIIRQR